MLAEVHDDDDQCTLVVHGSAAVHRKKIAGSFATCAPRSAARWRVSRATTSRAIRRAFGSRFATASSSTSAARFRPRTRPRLLDTQAAEQALAADFLGFGALERYLRADDVEEVGMVGPGGDWLWMTDGTKRRIDEIVWEDEAEMVRSSGAWSGSLGRSFTSSLAGGRRHACLMARACTRCSGSALAACRGSGTTLNIRKFPERIREMAELVERDMLDWHAGNYLLGAVAAYCNILIAGGFGSGKTTWPTCLWPAISESRSRTLRSRIRTNCAPSPTSGWDSSGMPARQRRGHRAAHPARPGPTALRMRPDRICVGEVRGEEAFDMIHAMASGTNGSLSTIHAESAREAVQKLGMHLLAAEPNVNDRLVAEWISAEPAPGRGARQTPADRDRGR